LNDVVQGSTFATSSSPRVSACSSFACFPEEPRQDPGPKFIGNPPGAIVAAGHGKEVTMRFTITAQARAEPAKSEAEGGDVDAALLTAYMKFNEARSASAWQARE